VLKELIGDKTIFMKKNSILRSGKACRLKSQKNPCRATGFCARQGGYKLYRNRALGNFYKPFPYGLCELSVQAASGRKAYWIFAKNSIGGCAGFMTEF
jgi:hypothetical protein